MSGLSEAQQRMRSAGVPDTAIDVFTHFYEQLSSGDTGMIPEADVEPLPDVVRAADLNVESAFQRDAAAVTAIITLNGGRRKSFSMHRCRWLLHVRGDRTFLDMIVGQVQAVRRDLGVSLPLLLMDSFRTRDDTEQALSGYADLAVDGLPISFVQHQEPKLRADDLRPI